MIFAALLLLAQDVPAKAPAEDDVEEVVIQATFGRTVMLFDKGADNKLRNCRIMVSSGSQRRDTNACQATPVCFAKTADIVTDCVELTAMEPATTQTARDLFGTAKPQIFDMPKLVPTKPALLAPVIGPTTLPQSSEIDKQRVGKLPPPPTDKSHDPAIRITTGNAEDK